MKLISTIAKNKEFKAGQLYKLFDESNMIAIRLYRLKSAQQIIEKENLYFVKNKLMLYVAKLLYSLSILFNVEWKVVRDSKREA